MTVADLDIAIKPNSANQHSSGDAKTVVTCLITL